MHSLFILIFRINERKGLIIANLLILVLNINECDTDICTHPGNGWYHVKEHYKTIPSSYVVPKGSPLQVRKVESTFHKCLKIFYFQNLLNNSTQWLRDTGVLAKLTDDELNAPVPIPDPKLRIDQPISIKELGIAFAGYSVGMALALFYIIWELCTNRKSRRVRIKPKRPTLNH